LLENSSGLAVLVHIPQGTCEHVILALDTTLLVIMFRAVTGLDIQAVKINAFHFCSSTLGTSTDLIGEH
jgi:hypothetical protein